MGGRTQYYRDQSTEGVFSFQFGGGGKRLGFTIGVNLYGCPILDYGTFPTGSSAQPDKMGYTYEFRDFVGSFHFNPIKLRRNITPYISFGPGYSMLVVDVTADAPVGGNLYERKTESYKYKGFFVGQVGAGALIRPFNGWIKGGFFRGFTIKVEYTRSFFRSPEFLNGDQFMISIGGMGVID